MSKYNKKRKDTIFFRCDICGKKFFSVNRKKINDSLKKHMTNCIKINIGFNKEENNMFISFINVNKVNIIENLENHKISIMFLNWLNNKENYQIWKSFFEKYNYSVNDKRLNEYKYDIEINKIKSKYNNISISIKNEHMPNFLPLLTSNKCKDGPIQKEIIPRIKDYIRVGLIR